MQGAECFKVEINFEIFGTEVGNNLSCLMIVMMSTNPNATQPDNIIRIIDG